jgi:hypothetical protein
VRNAAAHVRMAFSMRWFTAINEDAPRFHDYAEMLQVAVVTALERTALRPHVLYDGSTNSLTRWLRAHQVEVWPVRSRFYDQLSRLTSVTRHGSLGVGAGALLRVELPTFARRHGVHDSYILYTDVDVMFSRDPVPLLRKYEPRYFAVAPQSGPTDGLNSGVMLMNLPRLRQDGQLFRAYIERHLARFVQRAWDQDAYDEFYSWAHPPVRLRKLTRRLGLTRAVLWDSLPLELNWKAYWPRNDNAVVVHFHGPKPHDEEGCLGRQLSQELQSLATSDYYAACQVWRGEYAKIAGARHA